MAWADPETGYREGVKASAEKLNVVGNDLIYLKAEVESNDDDIADNAAAISSEAATREAADTAEASTRAAADTALSGRVTTLEGSGSIQGVGTGNTVTHAGLILTGSLQPDTTPTEGQTNLTSGVATLLPRGLLDIYLLATITTSNPYVASASVSLQVEINGTWRTVDSDSDSSVGGTASASIIATGLPSDGTNYRVTSTASAESGGSGQSNYYQYSKH